MKKLFISCPMKGRTEENIRKSMEKMHKIAEAMFEQELEVIPTYVDHKPPKNSNEAIWYLGKSIEKLAKADYFIGVKFSMMFKGCNIEESVACAYNIPHFLLNVEDVGPDVVELERDYAKDRGIN